MDQKRVVYVNKDKLELTDSMNLLTLSEQYQPQYRDDIILAMVDGQLRELSKNVKDGEAISFVTTSENAGRKTYIRGMIFVLLCAIRKVLGDDSADVRIEHSLGDGYYGEIEGVQKVTPELMQQVKEEMRQLVSADLPLIKRSVKTRDAVALFHKEGMKEKERLLRYRRTSNTNIYELNGIKDYFYGYMPVSTGILKYFDVFPYEDGFILQVPSSADMRNVPVYKPRTKLYNVLQESNDWGKTMGIETVGAMNEQLTKGNLNDIMLVQEAFMEKKIGEIASMIKEREGVKFVMIAGPSSSGKTTFSHRLSIQLRTLGFCPHPIAVDDYFVDRERTPKDENGNFNFECLGAIDVESFNRDMTALLAGERVELPNFNFKSGKREYKGNYQQLGEEDILVIEGIHGLNEALSYRLPRENKFRIYISALTQLNIDEHNRIPTTDARLLRRIVRDARTRGASATDTIRMWPSVRRGEEENIFPFQEGADVMFNSALIYELTMLKQYAEPLLFGVCDNTPEYLEAKRLLKFLDYFLGASSEDVPKNSILREFIGGSCFKV